MSPYVPRSDTWSGLKSTLGFALMFSLVSLPLLWMDALGLLLIPVACLVISAGLAGHAAGYSPLLAWLIGFVLGPWVLLACLPMYGLGHFADDIILIVTSCNLVGACFGNLIGYAQRFED
jgi:hypothetical protein